MTSQLTLDAARQIVADGFRAAGVPALDIQCHEYPNESVFIVRVPSEHFAAAAEIATHLDAEFSKAGIVGFVAVRKQDPATQPQAAQKELPAGVADARATTLAGLLNERARTTEIQGSLSYVPDAEDHLSVILTTRHHLVFGRRGAGKTALMVEAKRVLDERDCKTVWVNIQTYRRESAERTFLWLAHEICGAILERRKHESPRFMEEVHTLHDEIKRALSPDSTAEIHRFVPRTNQVLRRFLGHGATPMYVFIDDLHYLSREHQPHFLDMAHGSVRDTNAWLKVASIRHLSRWFLPSPPTGLQTGHDADHINLDVTLQSPSDAKVFLEKILREFAKRAGISSLGLVFAREALDRLVLASGAVPRDYLVLSANSVREARKRSKARLVGIEDVNRAAGSIVQVKLAELEDDAAGATDAKLGIVRALQDTRRFCLEEKKCTFFRVDFRDKESHGQAYGLLQSLLDVRLLHLLNPSLSDEHEAGRRSEVYMLDLSQFSGQRLKKYLRVLDFEGGNLVLKQTGTKDAPKVGETARKLAQMLRRGPAFPLESITSTAPQPARSATKPARPRKSSKAATSRSVATRRAKKT